MATPFTATERDFEALFQASNTSPITEKASLVAKRAAARIMTPDGPEDASGNAFPVVFATGQIIVVTAPADNDTLVVGGKTYTFVPSGATGNQILNTGTAAQIATRIRDKINTDTVLALVTAVIVTNTTINMTANAYGTAGNSIPLTTDGTHITKTAFAGGVD